MSAENNTKKIHEFVILHSGWASDNKGWVIELPDGSREVKTTSHGIECVMSKEELFNKIEETQRSLDGLIKAFQKTNKS